VLVRFVAVEAGRPLDIGVVADGHRADGHGGQVVADWQPGGVVGKGEGDRPVPVVEADQGLPMTACERVHAHGSDPVGGPVLDLAWRQCRVPVSDRGEVPQQGPDLAGGSADDGACEYLRHGSLLSLVYWPGSAVISR